MKIHPSLKTVHDAWEVTKKYGLGTDVVDALKIATALLNAAQVNTDILEALKKAETRIMTFDEMAKSGQHDNVPEQYDLLPLIAVAIEKAEGRA